MIFLPLQIFLILIPGPIQRFAEKPTYTEVNPGEDALLKCRISDKKGICSWQKDNKVLIQFYYEQNKFKNLW